MGCFLLVVFFCVLSFHRFAHFLSLHLAGSEHGKLAGEAAGGFCGSNPLQVPGEVHPQGGSKGHGECLQSRIRVREIMEDRTS